MSDLFLTVAEIAERLKLNPQTIRNWIDRGELPAIRVGARQVRVRQADLDAFLEAGSTLALPEAEPELDQGSVVAWATFGAAMAKATAILQGTDQNELVHVLDGLATATRQLVDALAQHPESGKPPSV